MEKVFSKTVNDYIIALTRSVNGFHTFNSGIVSVDSRISCLQAANGPMSTRPD